MHAESQLIELRGQGSPPPGAEREPDAAPDADAAGHRVIRCGVCRLVVARAAALFAMTGQDGPRVYVNPHGRVFELLTVRAAEGLLGVGGATTEHTWFAGYAWQVVCCGQCGAHLGWRFTSQGSGVVPASFYGLIRTAIVEDEAIIEDEEPIDG